MNCFCFLQSLAAPAVHHSVTRVHCDCECEEHVKTQDEETDREAKRPEEAGEMGRYTVQKPQTNNNIINGFQTISSYKVIYKKFINTN